MSYSRFLPALGILALATFSLAQAETAAEITHGPRGKGEIALTFDAGGDADCFSDLVSALSQFKVKSTFFVTGKWAWENPECAREITRQGLELGNHTWHHFALTQQPDAVIREELLRTEAVLRSLCGRNPRPLWRAPYGARDQRVLQTAASLGYRSIYWTLDSLDSVGQVKSVPFLHDRIANQTNGQLDGAIILMHVGYRTTAEVLPLLIPELQQRGFRLVTVSTLINEK